MIFSAPPKSAAVSALPVLRRCWLLLLVPGWLAMESTAAESAESSPAAQELTQTTKVEIPLRLDYPMMQQLLVTQLFTGPDQSREILDDPSGCSEIVLSDPSLAPRGAQLEVLAAVDARVGLGAPGACTTLLTWQGRIGVTGTPETRNAGTALGFQPDRVRLQDVSSRPLANARLQALADASARTLFKRFTVDLAPQIASLGDFLPEVLPRHSRQQIQTLLGGMHLGGLRVTPETLDANIVFDVEAVPAASPPERGLTEEELSRWETRWQLMDSVLVMAVKHYAAATQLVELREALLDALIESRYRLRDALVEAPEGGEDVVRAWFLQSWQMLAPVIRRIGLEQPGQEHLLLFSVIAATDALAALDRLGPAFGLEISADGLRRLARMINQDSLDEQLRYSEEVDPALRRLLEESLQATPPPSAWRLNFSLFPKAVAADTGRLNSWVPKPADLNDYLPLLADLLHASATSAMAKRSLEPAQAELFRQLVLATAWQESCWRQYVISDDRKLVPLRSSSGDVGLMQVNERVWRGFYNQQQLRWDINYNGAAGSEVLLDYLVKYALRKGEHRQPGGLANLARASYSAYNGGPSQVSRYRSNNASAYGKKVDAAFWDKYKQVAAGNEMRVSRCLGGDLGGPAPAPAAKPSSPASAGKVAKSGGDWLGSQPPGHYTLQLAVFSTEASARAFIGQNSLGAGAHVQRRRKGDAGQFLVLFGSYPTRSQADAAKRTLSRLQPWVRQFSDL